MQGGMVRKRPFLPPERASTPKFWGLEEEQEEVEEENEDGGLWRWRMEKQKEEEEDMPFE